MFYIFFFKKFSAFFAQSKIDLRSSMQLFLYCLMHPANVKSAVFMHVPLLRIEMLSDTALLDAFNTATEHDKHRAVVGRVQWAFLW